MAIKLKDLMDVVPLVQDIYIQSDEGEVLADDCLVYPPPHKSYEGYIVTKITSSCAQESSILEILVKKDNDGELI